MLISSNVLLFTAFTVEQWQATFGGTCTAVASALTAAFGAAARPFFPLVSTASAQTSASAFAYTLAAAGYPADVLLLTGQAFASILYYFDWTKVLWMSRNNLI